MQTEKEIIQILYLLNQQKKRTKKLEANLIKLL